MWAFSISDVSTRSHGIRVGIHSLRSLKCAEVSGWHAVVWTFSIHDVRTLPINRRIHDLSCKRFCFSPLPFLLHFKLFVCFLSDFIFWILSLTFLFFYSKDWFLCSGCWRCEHMRAALPRLVLSYVSYSYRPVQPRQVLPSTCTHSTVHLVLVFMRAWSNFIFIKFLSAFSALFSLNGFLMKILLPWLFTLVALLSILSWLCTHIYKGIVDA